MSTPGPSSPPPEGRLPPWDDLILLGQITRTQGHRGAVRLLPEFDPLDRFEGLKENELILRLKSPGSPGPGRVQVVHVAQFSYHQRFVILTLQEIPDMDAAEAIQGAQVYVRAEHLWDLEEGEFFIYEVVDFEVVDEDSGRVLGTVRTVETGAAHDFVVVRSATTKRDFYVPLVKEMVREVDKAACRIRVSLPEGLEEL